MVRQIIAHYRAWLISKGVPMGTVLLLCKTLYDMFHARNGGV